MKFTKLLFLSIVPSLLLSPTLGIAKPTKKPVAESTLNAPVPGGVRVFVKYSLQYYPSFTTSFDHLLLFPDGTAFDDIPDKPLSNFSAANIRRQVNANDIGRWRMAGKTLLLTFPKEKRTLRKHPRGWYDGKDALPTDSAYDIYYPVISPPRAKMIGAWKNKDLIVLGTQGGGTAMVAAGSQGDWTFNANGTFSDSAQSFASATTQNMGSAYKGNSDSFSSSNRSSKSSGKWRIDGSLLTLERNGKRTVHFAFLMPYWTKNMAQTDLMIDGDRWQRPKKK